MAPRNDYLSAACWAAFGIIVVVASWRMDRLENLGINSWSVPGLTPGLVGALIVLLAAALAWQARRQVADVTAAETQDDAQAGKGWGRTLLAAMLCVLFAGVSLGHGLSFMVEAAVFIFLFVGVFSWSRWREEGVTARGLLTTLVIAVSAAAVTSWLFESVFLVLSLIHI